MAESTIERSQRTMERLIDLQRNMAEMTLSALEWGESAQRQGIELTQSMLESAPGPQFTESMMERYLEGMEAIVPEMEQAMAEGTQAVTDPEMAGAAGTGRSSDRPRTQESRGRQYRGRRGGNEPGWTTGGRQRPSPQSMAEQPQPSQQSRGGRQPTGQRRSTGGGQRSTQQPTSAKHRSAQPMAGQQSNQRRRDRQASSDRSRSRRPRQSARSGDRYPETGDWVTPREYGGESTGTTEYQQRPLSAAPNPSPADGSRAVDGQSRGGETGPRQESQRGPSSTGIERGQQGGRRGQPREPQPRPTADSQRGHGRSGESMGGGDRSRAARASDRPAEGGQPGPGPERTEQGRLRDQYARRADTDRAESEQGSIDRGEGAEPERSSERRRKADTDAQSDQSRPPTERRVTDESPEEE
ncbi:hypothetical protein A6E15_09470 [Natrinema saccharevitans]|uniref:Phasin domain-containing protein n=2 Tax=Natrinema saccharevitans TaxID=301967 RepID=A0A1S8AXD3_9EURY|nr:hypothetical protein A6E15_09470 [Natrinema saccharevitans]